MKAEVNTRKENENVKEMGINKEKKEVGAM